MSHIDYERVAKILREHKPARVRAGGEVPLINLGRIMTWRDLVKALGTEVTQTADELTDFFDLAGYPLSEHASAPLDKRGVKP